MKQYEWYEHFKANPAMLDDAKQMEDFVRPHCYIARMGWRSERPRIIQFPYELVKWMMLLRQEEVKTYIEIGTSTGGTFFMVDSYLRATVPGYSHAIGYDVRDKLRNWHIYKPLFPKTEFHHMDSKDIDLGRKRYDAAFIDARHLERYVMRDYEKVKDNCGLVGFHDIVLQGATADKAWARIKDNHPRVWEFIDTSAPAHARCGIGVVATGDTF